MKKLLLCCIVIGITGCAHKMDLLKVNAASMKHRNLPDSASLKNIGQVESSFCKDNFAMSSGMSQGMIDEVLKKAEAEHKIDFILHPNFMFDGQCIHVTGDGARIK